MTSSITLSPGKYGDNYAVNVSFSNVSGKGILRSTREYSLAYIPKLDKWVGDVITHGKWHNLDEEEISELLKLHSLDKSIQHSRYATYAERKLFTEYATSCKKKTTRYQLQPIECQRHLTYLFSQIRRSLKAHNDLACKSFTPHVTRNKTLMAEKSLKFIDLFSGIGGIRKGFELACENKDIECECVFTSEIKPHAIQVIKQNHPLEEVHGDITKIDSSSIPDFDVLLAGFPCQAFSAAGKRLGFEDTRGTLFFDVARILKDKKPEAFLLENVEGLVNHDKENSSDEIGKTLSTILNTLDSLGYQVTWKVLNATDFGVPQERKRVYIAGTKKAQPSLTHFSQISSQLSEVLETGLPVSKSPFIKKMLSHYTIQELVGKSIKDKRGGENNIHSWDIELKGKVTPKQKNLLNALLKERRKKKWAALIGIDWMDGMPLTVDQISTFYPDKQLEKMLEDLTKKGYLKKEHPKKLVDRKRIPDPTLPEGYNIVAGKMSFEVNKVLDPFGTAPTLVAMDMRHLYVADGEGLRRLSLREGLRLFGYPDDFKFDVTEDEGFDLLGNTVVVSVIEKVSERLLEAMHGYTCEKTQR